MKVEKFLATIQDAMPDRLIINKLGKDLYELSLNENIKEVLIETEEGTETKYQSDLTLASGVFYDKNEIKGALVRLKYSVNAEYAVINKGISDLNNEDYLEYRNYVEECKSFVDSYQVEN